MKQAVLFMLTILLSSCWHYYKQLDTNNKPVKTDTITLADCSIQIYLEKKFMGDKDADYYVTLFLKPINKDLNVNVADISVKLFAPQSGKEYSPVIIKLRQDLNYGEPWVPLGKAKLQAVHNGQVLNLKTGNRYSLIYSFSGRHHSILKLSIDAVINNEQVSKTLEFKKSTEVELLH